MSGFQAKVNQQPNPAVPGDFASANPNASVPAGPGAFVAGASGANVGNFGWADANGLVTNAGSGAPTGFIARDTQALIVTWLAQSSMTVQPGYAVTLMSAGDFWAQTLTTATVGQKVFASNTTGAIETGAAGATIAGYTETKWFVGSAAAANDLIKITTWN
jgi:hypothetical protein